MLLMVLAVGLGLTALLWIGSAFAQGYLYTEPNPGIAWQAPAVGGGLTLFLMLWCVLNATASGATASQVPFDALFRAQTTDDYDRKPAARIWSYEKGRKKPVEYVYSPQVGGKKWDYKVPERAKNFKHVPGEDVPEVGTVWRPDKVEAIEIPDKNDKSQKVRFERRIPADKNDRPPYPEFVSADGWVMKAENNIGLPSAGTWGRFLVIVFLNVFHLALWFVGLWLVLRYEWFHALLLGGVLWFIMTVAVVPMLLNRAGAVAESAAPATAAGSAVPAGSVSDV
jgi:hypothetical protein